MPNNNIESSFEGTCSVGLACGKFQPFHREHLDYVLAAIAHSSHTIIGITNPDPDYVAFEPADPKRSTEEANPFTYYERHQMVTESLHDHAVSPERYDIVPFPLNRPASWFCYVPRDAVALLTLYDDDPWLVERRRKLEVNGLTTAVLWSKPAKTITGSQVRQLMTFGAGWSSLLPAGSVRVIERLNLLERLRQSPNAERTT
jgi:nicotinamide mononucleotide adenylyltransferase